MVGFVMWGRDEDSADQEWWVIRLMIDVARQGRGYGTAAMLSAIEAMKAQGAREIFLSFVPTNADGRAFYEKLGFTDTGRIKNEEIVVRRPVG